MPLYLLCQPLGYRHGVADHRYIKVGGSNSQQAVAYRAAHQVGPQSQVVRNTGGAIQNEPVGANGIAVAITTGCR